MKTIPKTQFLAIRHGQTRWNAEERYMGHADSPLTEIGRNQALAIGHRMKTYQFDALISSDLGRARETAAIIADCTGHRVKTDSRLRERNFGVLEGLAVPEIKARYAEVFDKLNINDPDFIIPMGESHRQHYQRNADFIDEWLNQKPGSTVAMVVHGGVLDSIFRYITRLPLAHPRCFIAHNASLSIFVHGLFYGTTRWVIDTWNDGGHLNSAGCYPV